MRGPDHQSNRTDAGIARIQRDGFLIALGSDWRIKHASDNIGDHFADLGPRAAGQPLAEFFGSEPVHALRNRLALMRDAAGSARLFAVPLAGLPRLFDVALHMAGEDVILEAFPAAGPGAADPAGMAREMAAALDRLDLPELMEAGARQLRAITGYERITLFRRSEKGGLERGANLGIAARNKPTAIPARARIVADAGADGCGLGGEPRPEILANAILGCPSREECAELAAEGCRGAMLLPLRSAGCDVGVALCRSQSPRRIRLDRLTAAELFADLLAMRMEICALR